MEKFQFNVGDYVETKDGKIGYINEITHNGEVNMTCVPWYFCSENKKVDNVFLSRLFNRIGKYDFTKPQKQNKIEPLSNMDFVCYDNKLADCKMNQQNVLEIYDKLNEIINYINSQEN